MTINGTSIFTYKFHISEVDGLFDLEPAKKVLDVFDPVKAQREAGKITVELIGKFDTENDMLTNVAGLKSLISGISDFVFPSHLKSVKGIILNGARVTTMIYAAKVRFDITVIEVL